MRSTVRTAGIIVLGALGALLWLSSTASAQVGSPNSEPFKPYSPTEQPAMFIPESPPATSTTTDPASEAEPTELTPAAPAEAVVAEVPAVEAPVSAAKMTRPEPVRVRSEARPAEPVIAESTDGAAAAVARPGPVERVKTVLSELASVCNVGVSFPTGGPVLAFAILAAALGLDSQRFQRTRWPADEDAPELLYAGDVIAPG